MASRPATDATLPPKGTLRREKKDESFFEKLGTLGRKKKTQQLEQEAENEAIEVEIEGAEAIDSAVIPVSATLQNILLEEGEEKRLLTAESRDDPHVREIIQLLIHWLNDELAAQRIVVKHIQEDLYDGQIIQKLIEKLANIKVTSHPFLILKSVVSQPTFNKAGMQISVLHPFCLPRFFRMIKFVFSYGGISFTTFFNGLH
ncbi:unnamed protein product [Gongylonema pulchrum]|uniref:PARVB n=1 Tax=Gongylonema pulchrum TaxID=637853 RepID=A0A183DR99_9BILA|nr:unnamed protein product [Gongylonema pulchrum]